MQIEKKSPTKICFHLLKFVLLLKLEAIQKLHTRSTEGMGVWQKHTLHAFQKISPYNFGVQEGGGPKIVNSTNEQTLFHADLTSLDYHKWFPLTQEFKFDAVKKRKSESIRLEPRRRLSSPFCVQIWFSSFEKQSKLKYDPLQYARHHMIAIYFVFK